LTETHKVYTSYPSKPSVQQPYFIREPGQANYWGLWFFLLLLGLVVALWFGYKVLNWWENLCMPYSTTNIKKRTPYHNYNNTNTTTINCKDTKALAKPHVNQWVQNNVFKAKPIVPPRVFVAGRMNGVEFQHEGKSETKYLMEHERNRYYTQKGISITKQDDIEAKWKKDPYNGI